MQRHGSDFRGMHVTVFNGQSTDLKIRKTLNQRENDNDKNKNVWIRLDA